MSGYPHTDLVSAFDQLTRRLTALATRLQRSQLPLWVPLTDEEQATGLTPRQHAISLYCNLWHDGDGDGRITQSRHGLVAIDEDTAELVRHVNAAKRDFQSAVQPFRQQQAEWRRALQHRGTELHHALASKGLRRLHLKQSYRQLPISEQQPERVGFNWYSSGRSIKRLTVTDAEKKLLKMGVDKPHIAIQLAQLRQLPADTPLAQIQSQAPLIRCNLRFKDSYPRQAMNLSLPLMYVQQTPNTFPEYNEPPLQAPLSRQRQIRSDCRIEDTPFLPSLRIHRYRSDA